MSKTNQDIFGRRLADRRKKLGLTQRDLAGLASVSVTSIQNYENGQIPGGDVLLRLARGLNVSMDWLMSGDGEEEPVQVAAPAFTPAAAERPAQLAEEPVHYNDKSRRALSIGDLLAKTAKVLESDTVYREALYSNIEAFHHGVTMDERLARMESQMAQVMGSVQARLDALEAENTQLRQELEHSRASDTLSDTG